MIWVLGALCATILVVGVLVVLTRKVMLRCPGCRARSVQWTDSATLSGGKPYRKYRCTRCQLQLVMDGSAALQREDHWVPGRDPVKPPRARVRG